MDSLLSYLCSKSLGQLFKLAFFMKLEPTSLTNWYFCSKIKVTKQSTLKLLTHLQPLYDIYLLSSEHKYFTRFSEKFAMIKDKQLI